MVWTGLPVPTKQIPHFPSIASWLLPCSPLSWILLRFTHSNTFKSSLSSANQLSVVMLVQLSSQKEATRLGTFQRLKRQKWCILSQVPRASSWLSRQIKSPMFQSCTIEWISEHKGPKHLGSIFIIPHCELRMTAIWDISCSCVSLGWCTLRNSNGVIPTSSAPFADKSHKNADVSFTDLRSYIPEISWVRSSKLPPLLRGGDKQKS